MRLLITATEYRFVGGGQEGKASGKGFGASAVLCGRRAASRGRADGVVREMARALRACFTASQGDGSAGRKDCSWAARRFERMR